MARNRTVGCRNLAARLGIHTSAPLNAGGGSGECCPHTVALPFKKEKPGPLGESACKKILGDLTSCEEKQQKWGKAEWRFKCFSMLKVPEFKNKSRNSLSILSIKEEKQWANLEEQI